MQKTRMTTRRAWRVAGAATLAGGLAIGAVLGGSASASAAEGTPNPPGPVAAPAPLPTTCSYTVVRNGAPVYANPSNGAVVLKTKWAGDTVTSSAPCTRDGGTDFVQVNLQTGGVGWMHALDLAGAR